MIDNIGLRKSIIEYIIRNFDNIKYFEINGEKYYKEIQQIKNKYNGFYELVSTDYNVKYNYISLFITIVDAIKFDKSEIKLKNGLFHSLNSPAFNYYGEGIPQKLYFINGIEYIYSDWLKNPQVRLCKLKKLLKK